MEQTRKIRYAVVGLGNIGQVAVLPGIQNAAENSELVALISSGERKLAELSARHHVAHTGGYDDMEAVLARSGADALYIALPNHMHRSFAERAACAGVHVLCEKPMALDEDDCRAMIEAAEDNQVKLMIAYRLHFDPANLRAVELVRSGQIGEARLVMSLLTHRVRADDIRQEPSAGGGALFDAGVYPINAARYLFADEPIEVFAYTVTNRQGVDDTAVATLRFTGQRFAQFTVSQSAASTSWYRVVAAEGDVVVEEAFEYARPMRVMATIGDERQSLDIPKHDQFGAEVAYFSNCILSDAEPEPSGEEGEADVRVVRALLESADLGHPVGLPPFHRARYADPRERIEKPGIVEPVPIDAPPPSLG